MTYEDLYNLTPRAYWNAVDGFYEMVENNDRRKWVRTRWSTCCLINMQLPKGKQLTPQKLLKFDWEKKEKEDLSTYEETLNAYQKFLKKRKLMTKTEKVKRL